MVFVYLPVMWGLYFLSEMYYQSQSTAFLLIFCCLNVLEATENLSNDEMDYLAGKVSVKDELLIEDEQLALAHIDMDIKDFV